MLAMVFGRISPVMIMTKVRMPVAIEINALPQTFAANCEVRAEAVRFTTLFPIRIVEIIFG